ncbi:uncharacterized protein LOC134235834 [Saccostrea cucullata]|uniref:uncharacterized protein LOC134235834 n=1 Tax=Saccostrea cuccullata TaxID=36930 RepID=UPI002ED14DB0
MPRSKNAKPAKRKSAANPVPASTTGGPKRKRGSVTPVEENTPCTDIIATSSMADISSSKEPEPEVNLDTTGLEWILKQESGQKSVVHYLDDFLFAGRAGSNACNELMSLFVELCEQLGVPLADDKTVWPSTSLTFLGFQFDSVEIMLRIPVDKVNSLKDLINSFMLRKKATLKEFQALAGLLNFCLRAIPSGRAFTRRIYDIMQGVCNPHHFIRVSLAVKEDLGVWLIFLDLFNDCFYFPQIDWIDDDQFELFTDSAGNSELGCGAFFKNHWLLFKWPSEWAGTEVIRDITFLELVPIVLAFHAWGISAFSVTCTPSRLGANINSRVLSNHHLQTEFDRLVQSSISAKTRLAYQTGLVEFDCFRLSCGLHLIWPPDEKQIIEFVASYSLKGLSSATVRTYLSGTCISFKCKLIGNRDPTQNFVIKKMVVGMSRLQSSVDARLPITPDLLGKILNVLPIVCRSSYETTLFSADFSCSFFGLFRVGGLVLDSKKSSSSHALDATSIQFSKDNSDVKIHLSHSKTDQFGKGVVLVLPAVEGKICPVKLLKQYSVQRPVTKGPFFCHFDKSPLTRYQFNAILKKSLSCIGVDNNKYKSHSFGIGGATTASINGMSDDQIQEFGRWGSKAYKRYIRIPTSNLIDG